MSRLLLSNKFETTSTSHQSVESLTFYYLHFTYLAVMGKITGSYGPSTWSAAKSFCEARGRRIMTIDSQEEEDYVENSLNPSDW